MIEILILLLHVAVAVKVCLLVLLQHGKGADVGAAFGSGSSGSLFGATGSANFLSRTTAVLAAMFFVTSLGLTWISGHKAPSTSVMDTHKVEQPVVPPVPAGAASVPQPAAEPGGSKAQDIPK
jgi:preprotein translocase subunit SecG